MSDDELAADPAEFLRRSDAERMRDLDGELTLDEATDVVGLDDAVQDGRVEHRWLPVGGEPNDGTGGSPW